jgi:hypothetical protein
MKEGLKMQKLCALLALMLSFIIGFVFLALSLFQMFVTWLGVIAWWGIPGWLAFFIAIPVGSIPILGTTVGIMGAMRALGWSFWFSFLLFFGPLVFLFIIAALSHLLSRFAAKAFKNEE